MIGSTNASTSSNMLFYLGTGASFDVSDVPGYNRLTADNFIVETSGLTGQVFSQASIDPNYGYTDHGEEITVNYDTTLAKNYNASTGRFTCSLGIIKEDRNGSNPEMYVRENVNASNFKVYLFIGNARQV